MPALFNDDIIVPSMLNRGVSVEDAREYTMIGCVEPTVQGKWGGRFGACFFNTAKALELALNNGSDPRTGIRLHEGSGDLSTFESFDEIMDAYREQVEFFARQQSIKDNVQDMAWEELIPTPLLSSLTSDCLARGREIKKGGAIYDFTGGQTGAIANTANSLAAIKKLVFEDKLLTGAELKQAIDTNFEGLEGEKIRQMLITKVPKYGNDDDYVDEIAKEAFSISWYKASSTRPRGGDAGRSGAPGIRQQLPFRPMFPWVPWWEPSPMVGRPECPWRMLNRRGTALI